MKVLPLLCKQLDLRWLRQPHRNGSAIFISTFVLNTCTCQDPISCGYVKETFPVLVLAIPKGIFWSPRYQTMSSPTVSIISELFVGGE